MQTVRQYETNRNLIDFIQNTWVPDSLVEVSKYDYTNDILGRRTDVAYTGAAFQTTMTSLSATMIAASLLRLLAGPTTGTTATITSAIA